MIPDAIISVLYSVVSPIFTAIPTVNMGLPSVGADVGLFFRRVDSLIPILGPLRLMAALLGLLVAWFVIRLVLLARYVFLP